MLTAIGAAIALRRKARKLTQQQLADKAGVERSFISTLERGRRNPTLITLHRLSASLDWNLVDLFRAADLGRRPTAAKQTEATAAEDSERGRGEGP